MWERSKEGDTFGSAHCFVIGTTLTILSCTTAHTCIVHCALYMYIYIVHCALYNVHSD